MSKSFSIQQDAIRRRGGFTLVELLIVIVIIIILAAITTAVGLSAKTNAQIRATKLTLKTVANMMNDYLRDGHPEPTDTTDPGDLVNWILAFKTSPDLSSKLSSLKLGTNGNNSTVLDGFGNAVRYVPTIKNAAGDVIKAGYFWSSGQDGVFSTKDDVFSTDAS